MYLMVKYEYKITFALLLLKKCNLLKAYTRLIKIGSTQQIKNEIDI